MLPSVAGKLTQETKLLGCWVYWLELSYETNRLQQN